MTLLTQAEAARIARVSRATISRWSCDGVIRSIRIGRVVRFDEDMLREDIAAFAAYHVVRGVRGRDGRLGSEAATVVTRAFQRALAAAGLPKVPFHSLRHTATSWMLELGMTMREVADVLGHSRPSMTADTYSHLTHDASERAARLMDDDTQDGPQDA